MTEVTKQIDTRAADSLEVAKAFRKVLKDNFDGEFSQTMTTMQMALAMALLDMTNEQKITAAQRNAVFEHFGASLEVAYKLLSGAPLGGEQ
jgi:methylphosphotriester-DNA--protein-cysteine methyltransferase